jgi:hypothetical protein
MIMGLISSKNEYPHIKNILNACPGTVESCEPPDLNRIERFEKNYVVKIPDSLRKTLETIGEIKAVGMPYKLLGLTEEKARRPTMASILAEIRMTNYNFPADLLPVEVLPERQIACVVLNGRDDPPVVLIDLDDPEFSKPRKRKPEIAPKYSTFCQDWLADVKGMKTAGGFLRREEQKKSRGEIPTDKAARPDEWRAYRFCSQDVLIGLPLVRFNREENITEIAAFPCADLSSFDASTPVRALLTLVLSDAYRSGGDLSLRFVATANAMNNKPVHVPSRILRFAWNNKINTKEMKFGELSADVAKRLYIRCLLCTDSFKALLERNDIGLNAAAVCYSISNGLWDAVAAEYIARYASSPNRVFQGASTQIDSLKWQIDCTVASNAMALGLFVKKLSSLSSADRLYDAEDDFQNIRVAFTPHGTAILRFDKDIPLEWNCYDEKALLTSPVEVLPIVAEAEDLSEILPNAARFMQEDCQKDSQHLILLSKDIETSSILCNYRDASNLLFAKLPLFSTTVVSAVGDRRMKAKVSRQ